MFSTIPRILNGKFQRSQPYYWPNGNVKYVGFHTKIDVALTEPNWEIYKYDQDGSAEPVEGPLIGAVNDTLVINSLAWNTTP